jgi:hypothetical protein
MSPLLSGVMVGLTAAVGVPEMVAMPDCVPVDLGGLDFVEVAAVVEIVGVGSARFWRGREKEEVSLGRSNVSMEG